MTLTETRTGEKSPRPTASKPTRVLITLPFPDHLVTELREVSPRLNIAVHPARKPTDVDGEEWEKVEVLYTNDVLPDPERAPNLKWIQFHWSGVDRLMDAPILRKEGLIATTLSGASASQMAEYVLMMLLALGHHIPDLLANQRKAYWPEDRWKRYTPVELRDSTVGIVGYGSIGRQVANLLHAFGARVLATKRDVKHPQDTGYMPPGLGDPGGDLIHRLYPPQALKAMLRECDFVVVAVPLAPDTRHLFGTAELDAMKPASYLVDISRGGIVDHDALIAALKDHKIAGAALDVFPEEPLPPESPLWKLPNALITPHISGVTRRYDERAVALFAENLNRYLSGEILYNQIDLERGY